MANARPIGDRLVFVTCVLGACFLIGLETGKSSPKQCPTVEGHTVVSTVSTKEGEFCSYVRSAKGLSVQKVKL